LAVLQPLKASRVDLQIVLYHRLRVLCDGRKCRLAGDVLLHAGGFLCFELSFRRDAGAPGGMSGVLGFALFGDKPLFAEPKSTGNLYRPAIEGFLRYSRLFYENKRYTDGDLCRMLDLRLVEVSRC
jgi:hypothetical protein